MSVAVTRQPRWPSQTASEPSPQPREQQRLRFRQGLVEGRVHGLLHQALRPLAAVAKGEELGLAQRLVHVVEGDFRKRLGE